MHLHPTQPAKTTALILGATGNLSFAIGTIFQGLLRYSQQWLSHVDIIIYHQGLSPADQAALAQLIPCRFIAYQFPHEHQMREQVLRDYGEMAFSRFECFRYLKSYPQVLWLDVDTLIQSDISPIFDHLKHGIAFRQEYRDERVRVNFTAPIEGFDMDAIHFNSGVMALGNQLRIDGDALADWCYQKTAEISPLLYYGEQGILLLLCQQFRLTIDVLPEKFNCEARYRRAILKQAAIIHAVGHRKFWKYYYFNDWYQFYKNWLAIGGAACQNKFAFFDKYGLLKYPLLQVAPNPKRYPVKFLLYLLKALFRCRY